MDLTRYWRAKHNGQDIEVQWTGMRLHDGWTLRLLLNGREVARTQPLSGRVTSITAGTGSDAIQVDFRQRPFRHHVTIWGPGRRILEQSSQPWNALALAFALSPFLFLFLMVVKSVLFG